MSFNALFNTHSQSEQRYTVKGVQLRILGLSELIRLLEVFKDPF